MTFTNGVFSGRGGHILTGTFRIASGAQGLHLTTSDDFFFDGSADPAWVLAKQVPANSADPCINQAAKISGLQHLGSCHGFPFPEVTGQQTALFPTSFEVDEYRALLLWCAKSQFLLGIGLFQS